MKTIGCLFMLLVLIKYPEATTKAAAESISIWGKNVVPSLFPYMVFCKMLAAQICRRGVPAVPAVAVLGLLGGSPSGAAVISEYASQGKLSSSSIHALSVLTGTISPMFLLNTIKPWVKNEALCVRICLSTLLGALMAALCLKLWTRGDTIPRASSSEVHPENNADPLIQSVNSVLNIGGCIVFFSVIATGVKLLFSALPDTSHALLHAVLEVSGGIHEISQASFPANIHEYVYAAAASFSGLSILSQNLLFLKPHGITYRSLIGFGLLRAFFSCLCTAIFQLG